MSAHQSAVGRTGTLIVATRGEAGPGEVLIPVRGGTEAFLAWSETPLPKGATVMVVSERGERTVDVIEWSEPLEGESGQ